MASLSGNLFIPGPPRTGTTSLASWLGEHPDVCASRPKETGYHVTDLPMRDRIVTLADYRASFRHYRGETHLLDATVWNLYSRDAIPNITSSSPGARFIVTLRNVAEQLASLHHHHLFAGFESEPDLEKAVFEPRTTRADDFRFGIDYLDVGRIGTQVQRLLDHVDQSRVLFIDFAELTARPETVHRRVLDWLDLETIPSASYRARNAARQVRSPRLQHSFGKVIRAIPFRPLRRLARRAARVNMRHGRAAIPASLEARILTALADEIELAKHLSGITLAPSTV